VETLAPDAAGLLLTAIAHGVRWNPMPPARWIADAVIVLRRQGDRVDWSRLCSDARQRSLSLLLAAALAWLAEEFAAPVPPDAIGDLAPGRAPWGERAELRARQRAPAPLRAVVMRWCVHRRRARAGADRPGVRGFLTYLRQAWGVGASRALPTVAARRLLAKLGDHQHPGAPS
jgi:hypothetical protein